MAIVERVEWLPSTPYNARDFRSIGVEDIGPGVYDRDSFRVTFSAGLTVVASPGIGYVRGMAQVDQGMYRAQQTPIAGNMTVTLAGANATNPRVDQIVLKINDNVESPGSGLSGEVVAVTGTPQAGATLDNRLGVGDTALLDSPSVIVLADVLVNANNSPALSNANIRDRRPYGMRGTPPPLFTDATMVMFEPPQNMVRSRLNMDGAAFASKQSACLMFLPKRIEATRVRWRYTQGGTPVGTGTSWQMAICDASGRLIARTGSVTFQGGAAQQAFAPNSPFTPALPAGTVFEIGYYYVWFGVGAIPSAQSFNTVAVHADQGQASGYLAMCPNVFLRVNSGGVTFPAGNTLAGMTDTHSDNFTVGNTQPLGVPVPTLATA